MIDRRWLFVCSCIALVTSAFTFVVRGDVLQDIGRHFDFSQEQNGTLEGAVFFGMFLSMLGGGFICDALGMRRIMFLAFLSHLIGSLGTIYADFWTSTLGLSAHKFSFLYYMSIIMGCGNGFTEVAVNPLIATLYPKEKTHYLNILHAWWPGGLMIGGLLTQFVVRAYLPDGLLGMKLWQANLWLILIPSVVYGLMLFPAKFPQTERVESGVTNVQMLKECFRPLFLIWGICMLMTAATELGPQKWQESVMRSTAGVSGTLILVYTSSLMFVLRHFAGPIAHKLSPVGMLIGSSILSGAGLYLLSTATDAYTAFLYATIYGLGIVYFWPTMLGVTAERFPKGGALALALMGSIGNVSISYVLPWMGSIVDKRCESELKETNKLANWIFDPTTNPSEPQPTPVTSKVAPLELTRDEWKTALSQPYGGSLIQVLTARIQTLEKDGQLKADAPEIVKFNKAWPGLKEELAHQAVEALSALQKANPGVADRVIVKEAARKELAKDKPDAETVLARTSLDLTALQAAAKEDKAAEAAKLRTARHKLVAGVQAAGFSEAFRTVSLLPVALILLFGGIFLYDRARGGYKAEDLHAGHGGH